MVGIRLLECSHSYYILRHQMYCRPIFKFTPITNDYFAQRHYHDLANSKGELDRRLCQQLYSIYNYYTNRLIGRIINNVHQYTNALKYNFSP